mmetsp:Transcript_18082/g.20885  ORF Transcript_18082/g.20885 Transcript_18082/m.20885 type:complete len:114 (-) Transcript_18082:728-1069(-)
MSPSEAKASGGDSIQENSDLVQTNLFYTLKTRQNRGPLRKLIVYSIVMAILPISGFFLAKGYIVSRIGVDKKYYDLVAGIVAVLLVNVVIVSYIIDAFSEPADNKAEEGKKTK